MCYMIFVQIASYRDPELIPTVLDLVDKAKNPEALRIVVAWQHDDNETLEPINHLIEYDANKIIIISLCKLYKGLCGAMASAFG